MPLPETTLFNGMSERRISILGAALVAIGPLAMSLFLPAMPEIADAFDTDSTTVKLTLTLYLAGFAFAQLLAGPLSDAIGRRPTALIFLTIFCVGCLVAVFSTSIKMLIFARLMQGVGAAVGVTISRAIVRDSFEGDQSTRVLNLIGIILVAGPAVGPTLGGLATHYMGWQFVFVIMTAVGLSVLFATITGLKETAKPDISRLIPVNILRSYHIVLGDSNFLLAATVLGGAVGSIYAEFTFLPFVLMDQVGLSPSQFGAGMIIHSASFLIGSLLMRSQMHRFSGHRLVVLGLSAMIIGNLGLLSLLFLPPTFPSVIGSVSIIAFGVAFVLPTMTTFALSPFSKHAGSAAALVGFLQIGFGFAFGTLGSVFGNSTIALAIVIPLMSLISTVSFALFIRKG